MARASINRRDWLCVRGAPPTCNGVRRPSGKRVASSNNPTASKASRTSRELT